MKKQLFLIAMLAIIGLIANAQWTLLNSNTSNNLHSVFFIDAYTGYAVGTGGLIIKTIDGGISWTPQVSHTSDSLNSVFFVNPNIGFAVGQNGTILKTTNGGTTWSSQVSNTTNYLFSVSFTNVNQGNIVGFSDIFLHTSDGGNTWTSQTGPLGNIPYAMSLSFCNNDTGYAVGAYTSFYTTTDGGNNWTGNTIINATTTPYPHLRSDYFINSKNGYAVGENYYGSSPSKELILKTTDGGNNWTDLTTYSFSTLNSVWFIDTDTGYAVGESGTLIKTMDGGSNWNNNNNSGIITTLNSVFFLNDANVGYIVGNNGQILKYGSCGNSKPTITKQPVGVTKCAGENITLGVTASNAKLFQWQKNGIDITSAIDSIYTINSVALADSGNYTCIVKTSCLNSDTSNIAKITIKNTPVANAGNNINACKGGSIILTASGGDTYSWSNGITQGVPFITNSSATYTVTVSLMNGCSSTASVNVSVYSLAINTYNSNQFTTCGTSVTLSTTNNYTGSGILIYNWSPTSGLNSASIASPLANPGSTTTYMVTLTSSEGCVATNQATVTLTPLPAEQICYVEFDSATSKNSINWATNLPANIDSVHIYSETSTNVWSRIGSAAASQAHFIDMNSNPQIQSYSYRISVKDTCGIETDTSTLQTTITLVISYFPITNTVGFTWSPYQGLSVPNYYIYGIANNGAETLIGSVLGNQYSYNYPNPSSAYVRYFVGFNTPTCSSKTNHLVKSNIVQAATGIIETAGINNLVSVYPNPVTDNLQIEINSEVRSENADVRIYDVVGNLFIEKNITTNKTTLDVSNFASGVYFVKATTEKGVVVKKFVKE